jgi:MFS family permease
MRLPNYVPRFSRTLPNHPEALDNASLTQYWKRSFSCRLYPLSARPAMEWSGDWVLLSASGLFGAGLSLVVGMTSDRLQRKPTLSIIEAISLFSSPAVIFSAQTWILVIAAILSGFGRGANGAAGPFSPAEQARLAEEVLAKCRGRVYSLNAALGFFGMGLGAMSVVLPTVWDNI